MLAVILLVVKYGRGFLSNIAVLIGIIAGTGLSFALGKADFAKVASAKAFAIVTMRQVMIVVMIGSLGMFLALGEAGPGW
ncbi:hypothetical protein [Janthinobacterium sp. LB3P112]|uniref:hypothetical protein n=1 Tax=Janthinobacterium sp. LB3P112 TaxID=3424196 RepID=UPI003F24025F